MWNRSRFPTVRKGMAPRFLVLGVVVLVSSCGEVPSREHSASPETSPPVTVDVATASTSMTSQMLLNLSISQSL